MTDRLTPAMLRDLADLIWGRDLPTPPNDFAATVQIEIAEGLRNLAARREAEGQAFDWMAERDGVLGRPQPDAPPPSAPFVTDHKWLDPECHASGCQTLILKAEVEKLKDQRDKYMWQVRDTCARAEAAEARVKSREVADHALVDRYRNPATGAFNFPDDVAAIIRRLDDAEADAKRLRAALEKTRRLVDGRRNNEALDVIDSALAQGGSDG